MMTSQAIVAHTSLPKTQSKTATQTMISPHGLEQSPRSLKALNTYSADQQIKLLHLHAEAESLLQHVQAVKQRRQRVSVESN